MIRVASYNIRKSVGLDRRRDPQRILDVLNQINPDIIALQEVDRRTGKRETTLPRPTITSQTDYTVADIAQRPDSIGWHGNALLLRKTAKVDRVERLELPALEPRGAVMADVTINGFALRIVGAHLGLLRSQRRRQLKSLFEQIDAQPGNRPTVLMGDLNEWKQSCTSFAPFRVGYSITAPGASFHSAKPLASLDRFITSETLTVEMSGVHHSEKADVASDHLPIWADISLPRCAQV